MFSAGTLAVCFKSHQNGEHSCVAVSALGYMYKMLSCPQGGSLARLGATGAPAREQKALGPSSLRRVVGVES